MANVSVLGAGSWGLGLALLLNNNGHNVTVWSVLKDEVAMLQTEREHKRCLPGVKIPDSITVSGDTENVIGSADVLVLAVASPYTRSTAKMIAPFVKEGQIIVNVAKGVEEHTLLTLCQIVEEEIPCAKVAVLSGPSHAEEVSRGIPTTCVIGAHEKATANYKKLPQIIDFRDKDGNDRMQEEIQANYNRVKQEVQQIVTDEMERIKNDPNLQHLIKTEE